MEWQFILALVLGIPLMLFTHIYMWYLIIDGIYALIKEVREKKAARGVRGAKSQPIGARR